MLLWDNGQVDFVKGYTSMNFVSGSLIHIAFGPECCNAHLTEFMCSVHV